MEWRKFSSIIRNKPSSAPFFLDVILASANLSLMHTARGYKPAWRFPARGVIKL